MVFYPMFLEFKASLLTAYYLFFYEGRDEVLRVVRGANLETGEIEYCKPSAGITSMLCCDYIANLDINTVYIYRSYHRVLL